MISSPSNVSTPSRRRVGLIIGATIVLLIAVVGAIFFIPGKTPDPYEAPSLAVKIPNAPENIDVGVVVSFTEDASQGAGWDRAVEGASVAAWRLGLSGVNVRLHVVSDKGSAEGVKEAVAQLKEKNVSGIIAATDGTHTTTLTDVAAQSGIPLIYPYASPQEAQGEHAWTMAPSRTQTETVLADSLRNRSLTKPLVLFPEGQPLTIPSSTPVSYAPGAAASVIDSLVQQVKDTSSDSIVVSGSPADLAAVVKGLREKDVHLPLFVTKDGQNPLFAQTLLEAGVDIADLSVVGVPTPDVTAFSAGLRGAQASNFVQSVTIMSRDNERMSIDSSVPFNETSIYADAQSHDALLALVHAIAASSSNPDDVAEALTTQQLSASNGLVGPDLDFSSSTIVSWESMLAVQATGTPTRAALTWFDPSAPGTQ